jgi:uncharacterized protein YkwD
MFQRAPRLRIAASKLARSGGAVAVAVVVVAGCFASPRVSEDEASGLPVTPVTAPYLATPGGKACTGTATELVEVRASITRIRAMAGLPPLDCSDTIGLAAAAHADYADRNGTFGHTQEPGRPGFTGATFCDRMRAKGFVGECTAEIMAQIVGAPSIDGRFGYLNSIYHRTSLLRIESSAYGYGASGSVSVLNFGRPAGTPARSPQVVWPPNGAENVLTTFHASNEKPNPVAPLDDVGSPVTLIAGYPIGEISGLLEGPAGKVETMLITSRNDPANLVRSTDAHLVAKAPLAKNAKYRATFTFKIAGQVKPATVTTQFTTGPS